MSIIKRIDSLGRIVLPKNIRDKMDLNENDDVEITIDESGRISIRKYSKLKEKNDGQYSKYVDVLSSILNNRSIMVTDTCEILYLSNKAHSALVGEKISRKIFELMIDRKVYTSRNIPMLNILGAKSKMKEVNVQNEKIYMNIIAPIIIDSNVEGSVIMYSKEANEDIELKDVELLKYLAKLIEKCGIN